MEALWQDLHFGTRILLKSPGFTFIAVLTLALGVGANTAVFSIVNALLLRPLPGINAPTQLVALDRTKGGMAEPFGGGYSYPDFRDHQHQNKVFSDLLAFRSASVDLSNGGETKRIQGMVVSGNYFTVLDVKPALGRTFLPDEDRTPNTSPVTILGFDLWQRSFSADPNVVGKLVTLNGRGFTVVGIAPKGFRGTDLLEPCEIWVPLAMYAQVMPNVLASFADRDISWLSMLGRLKPELSLAQAQAELNVLARQLALAYPKENREAGVRLARGIGLEPWLREGARDYLGLLMAVVGLVLLIGVLSATVR